MTRKETVEKLVKQVEALDEKIELLTTTYGSIESYHKEVFGLDQKSGIKADIKKALDEAERVKDLITEFDYFWNGDDKTLSFERCKTEILDIGTKSNNLSQHIETKSKELTDFIKNYKDSLQNEIKGIEGIKNDLKAFKDLVVGNSLFKSFQDRANKNDNMTKIYSLSSILFLLGAAAIMLLLLLGKIPSDKIGYLLPISISIILLTASYVSSGRSKIYHKAAEEYYHKSTMIQSFVGYTQQNPTTPGDYGPSTEYSEFFKEILSAIKRNPSDKIDKLLHFKFPWEKAIDSAKDIAQQTANIVNEKV